MKKIMVTTKIIVLRGRLTNGKLGYGVSITDGDITASFLVDGTEQAITDRLPARIQAENLGYAYYSNGCGVNKIWDTSEEGKEAEAEEFLNRCIGIPIRYPDGEGENTYAAGLQRQCNAHLTMA